MKLNYRDLIYIMYHNPNKKLIKLNRLKMKYGHLTNE